MKEPTVKIGFIIFNESYKTELQSENGHRKTAFNWIKNNNLMEKFHEVLGTNGIYDEEDFLMEYIGAIKLYGYSDNFYCMIPKRLNIGRKYFEKYFQKLGYKVISAGIYNEEKSKINVLTNQYNRTIIKKYNKDYIYNPLKEGD